MAYLIKETDLERQKLLAKLLAATTDKLLSNIRLPAGIKCLDLGCGIGETTRHLARRLDSSAEVVGVELNPDLVDAAKDLSSGQGQHIRFEQGDVTRLNIADNSFDFVFARYLLMHLPEPEAVLKEMFRVCRPGGVVAVIEPDFSPLRCYPDSWAYEQLPLLFAKLFPDANIGRKLWCLFQGLGYNSADTSVDCLVETRENDLRRIYRMSLEAVKPFLIGQSHISEQNFERLHKEMERVEQEKNVLCVSNFIFSAWAMKS
jgi:ubiquinone/menaquinone biosynthesis C-methylase UbiE